MAGLSTTPIPYELTVHVLLCHKKFEKIRYSIKGARRKSPRVTLSSWLEHSSERDDRQKADSKSFNASNQITLALMKSISLQRQGYKSCICKLCHLKIRS